jgi:hypothetical protein
MGDEYWHVNIYIFIYVYMFFIRIYIYVCVCGCLSIYIYTYIYIYIHEDWSKTQIFFEQIWPCAGLGPEDSRALLSRVWFPPPGQGAIKRGRGADLPKRLVAVKRLCELQPPGRSDQRWKDERWWKWESRFWIASVPIQDIDYQIWDEIFITIIWPIWYLTINIILTNPGTLWRAFKMGLAKAAPCFSHRGWGGSHHGPTRGAVASKTMVKNCKNPWFSVGLWRKIVKTHGFLWDYGEKL